MTVVDLLKVSERIQENSCFQSLKRLPASLPEMLVCLIGVPALTVLKTFAWCPKQ